MKITFKVCPKCKGYGWVKNPRRGSGVPRTRPCPTCEGSGELTVADGRALTPAESTKLALQAMEEPE